jgi:hypothetical protein
MMQRLILLSDKAGSGRCLMKSVRQRPTIEFGNQTCLCDVDQHNGTQIHIGSEEYSKPTETSC